MHKRARNNSPHCLTGTRKRKTLEAHALHATLTTDVCRLADSTPSSECFPPDVVIRQIGNGLISEQQDMHLEKACLLGHLAKDSLRPRR